MELGWKKNERERNDLAKGPRSRTELNDFKKVGTCPALLVRSWPNTFFCSISQAGPQWLGFPAKKVNRFPKIPNLSRKKTFRWKFTIFSHFIRSRKMRFFKVSFLWNKKMGRFCDKTWKLCEKNKWENFGRKYQISENFAKV